ncbi:MAG: Vgb family protein [Planctomycetota bacterium]
MQSPRILLLSLAIAGLVVAALGRPAQAAQPADDDFYISLPQLGAIHRLDPTTLTMTPFVSGMSVPFYGVWTEDDVLYVPDRGLGIVFRVSATGALSVLTAGGFLQSPVTLLQAPDGDLIVSDIFQQTIVRVSLTGQQTLIADAVSSGGLLSGPGGMAYGPDGTLYVANNLSHTIVSVDDRTGAVALVSDGNGLISSPGGIAVDGAGNLYVANYHSSRIVRVRLDTGVTDMFCEDLFIVHPNDVRIAPEGGLHVTMENSALVRIDPLGQLEVLHQDVSLGEWDGVCAKSYLEPCLGAFVPYGAGLAGSGGFTPRLSGLFAPCPGAEAAIELDRLLGGSGGALLWSLAPATLPFKQGNILVDLGAPSGLIPLAFPGVGAGGGALRLSFTFPDDPIFSGLSLYLQVLAADPGAPAGFSLSNGLHEAIG